MSFEEFKKFWLSFVLANEEFYHIRDIEHGLACLKTVIMDVYPQYKDADFLLQSKESTYGMLLGILFALDCFPTPEFVELEKLTKIRIFCKTIVDLFKSDMQAHWKK